MFHFITSKQNNFTSISECLNFEYFFFWFFHTRTFVRNFVNFFSFLEIITKISPLSFLVYSVKFFNFSFLIFNLINNVQFNKYHGT